MTKQFHGTILDEASLEQLFTEARTYNDWLDQDVTEAQLHQIYDLLKMAPTSANMQPARFVWVKSDEAKAQLVDCVAEGNKDKVKAAPVTVIIGYDTDFHEELPWLFPHADAKSWFEGDEEGRKEGAFRNSALQGAYLMLAARAVGLDCGAMSGYDAGAVNTAFFGDRPSVKSNFICAIGHGDPTSIFDRSPRPDFDTFNTVI